MEEKEMQYTCVDCGTQNCKFKTHTYSEFCPTVNLKDEDLQWVLEKYEEGRNHDIMVASAEVEFEGRRWYDIRLFNMTGKYSTATSDRLLWSIDQSTLTNNSALIQQKAIDNETPFYRF